MIEINFSLLYTQLNWKKWEIFITLFQIFGNDPNTSRALLSFWKNEKELGFHILFRWNFVWYRYNNRWNWKPLDTFRQEVEIDR